MNQYDVIVFDLDDTLALSKTVIDAEMALLLEGLLRKKKVAVISGGGFPQFIKELLDPLSASAHFSNLHIFPTDGAAYYHWNGAWEQVYMESLSPEQKEKIRHAFAEALPAAGFTAEKTYGELIEDRESAIVFSALGQNAPLELKRDWDPDGKKRAEIKKILDEKLPEFEVKVAGTTSIDITPKNIDKAYGIQKMIEYMHVPVEKMVFIGDALFPGGNDEPVIATGIPTIRVANPEETKQIIKQIIS